jgi:hypothetical protein
LLYLSRAGRVKPDQTAGRVGENPHFHAVTLMLARVVRRVMARSHADLVDAQQRPVERHEGLARRNSDRLVRVGAVATITSRTSRR